MRTLIALLALAISLPGAALAQDYPDKPIRVIVPSPPGGGTDGVSRLLANKLGASAGWKLVLDNRPGAGGNIGMDAAAKSEPDGYTIAMGESANLAINPFLYRKMPFDPAADLAPVALVGTVPLVLVVPTQRPWESLEALTAEARTKQLSFASSGNGTVGHLVGETWKRAAKVDALHVPYKGAGPVMTDLLGGRIDLHFASLPAALPQIKAGKLRALAVTSARRAPSLPDVPTLSDKGLPGFDYHVFYGVVAPVATPKPIVTRLNAEIDRALQAADLRASLADLGIDVRGGPPEKFAEFLAAERAKMSRAVKESGAAVD